MIKAAILVSGSNLIANGTTFLIMMLAAKLLPIESFASFSLSISLCMMLTMLLDFGIGLTLVRFYCITRNADYINGAMTIKWITFIFATIPILVTINLSADTNSYWTVFAWGLLGAGTLNLWTGCRAIEQAKENFSSYAYNNIWYSCIRTTAGIIAFWTEQSWEVLFIATFIVPGLLFVFFQHLLSKSYQISLKSCGSIIYKSQNYSVWVFMSSAFYSALLYIPQFVIAQRLTNIAVSSYGLALGFLGVASLVASSTRTVLIPILTKANTLQQFNKKLIASLPAYLFVCVTLLGFGGALINNFYSHKLPEAHLTFLICGAGLLTTVYIGFFNIAIHTIGRPFLEVIINLLRLVTLIAALFLWGCSLVNIAMIFSIVLIIGELALAILVASRIRRRN